MNIYKTEVCENHETTISIEIDSEKKTDVEFAREFLKVTTGESIKITQKIDDIVMTPLEQYQVVTPSELYRTIEELRKIPGSWIKVI